jgi:hypothetical protein
VARLYVSSVTHDSAQGPKAKTFATVGLVLAAVYLGLSIVVMPVAWFVIFGGDPGAGGFTAEQLIERADASRWVALVAILAYLIPVGLAVPGIVAGHPHWDWAIAVLIVSGILMAVTAGVFLTVH